MKRLLLAICLLVFAINTSPAAPPDANPRLGINFAGPADWMTELPFVDVFRTARPWISQKKGAGWGQGPELAVDEFGWVKRLEAGCYAEAMPPRGTLVSRDPWVPAYGVPTNTA